MEDNDLVDAVEEFGAEVFLQDMIDRVARHSAFPFPKLVAQQNKIPVR